MPINVAAYALPNRSSEVTADVVARLGFIPDRVERKMTVGQQRRGRRKKKLRGRGGTVQAWGIFTTDALRKYAREKQIKPFPSKKPDRIQVLIDRADADTDELNAMIRDGSVEGGVKNYMGNQAPVSATPAETQQAAEQARAILDNKPSPVEPSPQPEGDSELTYSQPPTNPAEGAPPADVSQSEASTVNETALVRQATSSILSEAGFNSLDSIDTVEDVSTLNESIDTVAANPPQGVIGALWSTISNVAGRNTLQQVGENESTPVAARQHEVMAAAQNLRENPAAARLFRQRLVTPGQVADSQFVSNLEYTALSQQQKPRRYTKVPRYRGTRFAKK